ncbi:MAG: DUF4340 domain-containing protein [Planctomycetota bacterium]|nr:DUF4340 domain-containing protein [Planctomycetota bacterium]MDG2144770.1 DUF4340 domain-containing protein [Planctomycetota bacterium]
MHKSATLIILVLVGALYGLSQWNEQKKTDDQEQIKVLGQSQALLAGIGQDDFTRLAGLRIDNLRNGTQVTMERDGAGTWFLTDPVAWPAEPSILNLLFTTLQRSRGVEVLDVTAEAAGLEPPKVICDFTFADSDVAQVSGRWRIEIGDPDLDPKRLFLASTGPDGKRHIMRVTRTLESTFQRFVPDYRKKDILRFDPEDIIAFRRTGAKTLNTQIDIGVSIGPAKPKVPNPLIRGEAWEGIDLDFQSDKAGWRMSAPFDGRMDPQPLSLLLRALSQLDCTGFQAEAAQIPGLFGLDDPEMEIELRNADGESFHLEFSRTPTERDLSHQSGYDADKAEWLCRIKGKPTVFEVTSDTVMLCSAPATIFFDYRILRGDLAGADSFTYQAAGKATKLERLQDGLGGSRWVVSGQTATGKAIEQLPAATDLVEAFLAEFRQAELGEIRPSETWPAMFVAETISVDMFGQERGGEFARDSEPDSTGYLFRRFGDQAIVEVSKAPRDMLLTGPEHFLDRRVHEYEELRISTVVLERVTPGPDSATAEIQSVTFERSGDTGRWNQAGATEEAKDFALIVDRLRSIKTLTWDLDERPALSAPIQVTLNVPAEPGPRGRPAETVVFTIGNGAGAPDPCELTPASDAKDRGRANLFPGLWDALDHLL